MRVLLYSCGNDSTAKRVQSAIANVTPPDRVEVCSSLLGLGEVLRRGTSDLAAVVLCVGSSKDMAEILSMGDWFLDLRTILLLPDREVSTFTQAVALRPRFISYLDADLADVSAVVAKMLAVHGERSAPCRLQSLKSHN